MRARAFRLLLVAMLAGVAAAFGAAPGLPATGCMLYAGPNGNDAASGSGTHPFRTVQHLVTALPNGGVGCLKQGVFYGRVNVTRPVTLRGNGSASSGSVISGGLTYQPAAQGSALEQLTVHGGGHARAAVLVRANDVHITGNSISGPGFSNVNAACIFLDLTRGTVIDGNRLEACAHGNVSAPGVLVGSAYGTQITNNVIVRTPGYGIVLGPNAQHTTVSHNLVDANAGGLYLNGNAHTASSFNAVRNNIFSNSTGQNVHATWGGYLGKADAVVSNCLWNGGVANDAPAVQLTGNLAANPHYAKAPADYSLTSGPCIPKRPSIVGVHWHALAPFRVTYNLRALPSRVQIVNLGLSGVAPGVHVNAVCTHGCSLHWSGPARGGPTALSAFKGHWLPVGATIDIRVTSPWLAGAWSRVTVTGLPHGVSVSHACLLPGRTSPVSCTSLR